MPKSNILKRNRKEYKSHCHCVFRLKYHLVLVTKYRRKCFTDEILAKLEKHCECICKQWGVGMEEFGGEENHIHLLLDMHPNLMLSRFVNSLKTVTSRMIRKEFGAHLGRFYYKPVLWTRAYCVISAGGAPLCVLSEYIQNQGSH